MKTVAIIQARMGSTRLPGKVLMKLQGHTVLYHVIERVKQAKLIDEIIVATTTLSEDDVLVEQAELYGVRVFRGSSENVLSRYYEAARQSKAEVVVRITSDCPLIDPIIVDEVIEYYKNHSYSIVTNAGNILNKRTFPRGMDVEVFSRKALELANQNTTIPYHLEHVTPYIYEVLNNTYYFNSALNHSRYRLTLDTVEDFELLTQIYNYLYINKHDFYLNEILHLLETNSKLNHLNNHIEQKTLK